MMLFFWVKEEEIDVGAAEGIILQKHLNEMNQAYNLYDPLYSSRLFSKWTSLRLRDFTSSIPFFVSHI